LARELGVHCVLDPTITPGINGDREPLRMRVSREHLQDVFHDTALVGNVAEFCSPPAPVTDDILDGIPCSAGHTSVYVSPYGDVYPCVQFPLVCGNVRRQLFREIWNGSPQLREVRSIRARHLHTCSGCGHVGTCSRCPGLAYMEGDMLGPSSADCDKAYARTGIVSTGMTNRRTVGRFLDDLVQISV
jgi:AdoMet-dependent heme synthase